MTTGDAESQWWEDFLPTLTKAENRARWHLSTDQLHAWLALPHEQQRDYLQAHPFSAHDQYLETALLAETVNVALARVGTRNGTLNRAAFALGQLIGDGLDEQWVRACLLGSARQAGLPDKEIAATINSGIRGGLANPRVVPALVSEQPIIYDVKTGEVITSASSALPARRTVTLTAADTIPMRPVHWLWQARVALGTFVLIGGREGIGKSTLAYTILAQITRGTLPGAYFGQPKAVIVCATEDSWSHTIVPRLAAAGADLSIVFRIDVTLNDNIVVGLTLPHDLAQLERLAIERGAGAILLDPLMSRLDGALDSHKDSDVRTALEPLVRLAENAGVAIFGIIHVNKSGSTDPLTTLMASRAFVAVARAVLFVMLDPDDTEVRMMGQPKNNLGASDVPTLTFRIESAHVADTDEGPVTTGRIAWGGESDRTIQDVLESTADASSDRTAVAEAVDWLADHLAINGGTDAAATIKTKGNRAGHTTTSLGRARRKLHLEVESSGYPRRTFWTLPGTAADPFDQPTHP